MKWNWIMTLVVGLSIGALAHLLDERLQLQVLTQRGALGDDVEIVTKAVERLPRWQRFLLTPGLALAPVRTTAVLQRAMRELEKGPPS